MFCYHMSYRTVLTVILIQASLAMLGSLYFSNFWDPLAGLFSGTWFEPCHLCWWGRILMYPLVAISVYGLIKKDKEIWFLTGFLSLAGVLLAGYHYLIQYQASLNVFSCWAGNDCTQMWWHLGFVTIPFLELVAFAVIFVCSMCMIIRRKK